ncbi:MAG: orotidine-5'-phosphate decarboxylase [Micrococcales bacterium]
MPTSFSSRLTRNFEKYGQLCVGIDPHSALIEEWGLSDGVEGLRTFAMKVLESSVDRVGIIKPQVSFFERFGSKGFAVLEELASAAADSDLLVIMDAKRGDIGSTMDGYFDAWLAKSAPFICDALTVSPYLGFDSLNDVFARAIENGKGVFVLAATSNPEGKSVQKAQIDGQSLAADVMSRLEKINRVNLDPNGRLGNFGAVVGATLNLQAFGLGHLYSDNALSPILAPGFGAQGAELANCGELFGVAANRVLASVSRSVLSAGSAGLSTAIEDAKDQLVSGLARD